jgi:hypothetical protein
MVTKVGIDATLAIDLPYKLPERVSNPLTEQVDLNDIRPWKGLDETLQARIRTLT